MVSERWSRRQQMPLRPLVLLKPSLARPHVSQGKPRPETPPFTGPGSQQPRTHVASALRSSDPVRKKPRTGSPVPGETAGSSTLGLTATGFRQAPSSRRRWSGVGSVRAPPPLPATGPKGPVPCSMQSGRGASENRGSRLPCVRESSFPTRTPWGERTTGTGVSSPA